MLRFGAIYVNALIIGVHAFQNFGKVKVCPRAQTGFTPYI